VSAEGTDRTRRWRERKEKCAAGNHSLCTPRTKCPAYVPASAASVTPAGDVTGDVTSPPSVSVTKVAPPADLGARGAGLWERVDTAGMGPLHLVVLEEACRIADTLARLHAMAEDGRLVEIARNEAESSESVLEVRVVVNPLLGEIRQQQEAFRKKVSELRVAGRAGMPGAMSSVAPAQDDRPAAVVDTGGGGIGDLINIADWRPATEG